MATDDWKIIRDLGETLKKDSKDLNLIEGYFNLISDRCFKLSKSKERHKLEAAYQALKRTYALLSLELSDIDETSHSFFLGRIVTFLDLIATAILRQGPPMFEECLQNPDYLRILNAIGEHAEGIFLDSLVSELKEFQTESSEYEKNIGAMIDQLEEAKLIISYYNGKKLHLSLSQACKEIVSQMMTDKQKPPLEHSRDERAKVDENIQEVAEMGI